MIFQKLRKHTKKSFTYILVKHRYIPYINNLLLLPLYNVIMNKISQKFVLLYNVNYDAKSREAWIIHCSEYFL